MPAGGKHLRCDSSVQVECSPATSGIRHVRGSTRGIALLKASTGGKLTVHIPDGRTGGDDKASSMLSSHIDALVRQHVPFDMSKWKEVLEGVKSYVMNLVLEKMEALQLQYESEGKSYTEVEIFAELEEARLQIEEMRARQLEYEALLFRYGADDAEHLQMMEEQQLMMEEQQRRADADDGRVATKKKDEEHRK
ncbi:hypothetical protein CJ030_MR8G024924 [Morella rubra]|uniref:Uncharacterized protein n=1 Tax=Morella rubra TaxID=262757 RepID=A0A6A1URA3_9ROSI|nr:hypothetical protein CJ030_MR8G024924 [Morella rubra]